MNLDERENYSQDGQSFQNDTQYKNDDSVSNVLDNSINDEEQRLNEDYKDADDIDPDDYEDDFNDEDLDEDDDLDEDLDEEDESDFNETNLENDINETGSDQPREF